MRMGRGAGKGAEREKKSGACFVENSFPVALTNMLSLPKRKKEKKLGFGKNRARFQLELN